MGVSTKPSRKERGLPGPFSAACGVARERQSAIRAYAGVVSSVTAPEAAIRNPFAGFTDVSDAERSKLSDASRANPGLPVDSRNGRNLARPHPYPSRRSIN